MRRCRFAAAAATRRRSRLKNRGEQPVPIERMMRDARINLIFEGSSEIMRLFLAREALDPHLKVAGGALDSRLPMGRRAAAGAEGVWILRALVSGTASARAAARRRISRRRSSPALGYVAKTSRRLARTLFHAMAKHGPKLERKQLTLGRIVDIGTELFAITATALYADALVKRGETEYPRAELEQLVQSFVADAKARIAGSFAALAHNNDGRNYQLTQSILEGKHRYLRRGIVE